MLIKIFDIQFRVKLVILLSCGANRAIHGEVVLSKLVNWDKKDTFVYDEAKNLNYVKLMLVNSMVAFILRETSQPRPPFQFNSTELEMG